MANDIGQKIKKNALTAWFLQVSMQMARLSFGSDFKWAAFSAVAGLQQLSCLTLPWEGQVVCLWQDPDCTGNCFSWGSLGTAATGAAEMSYKSASIDRVLFWNNLILFKNQSFGRLGNSKNAKNKWWHTVEIRSLTVIGYMVLLIQIGDLLQKNVKLLLGLALQNSRHCWCLSLFAILQLTAAQL